MKPCTTCELDAHRLEPAEVHVELAAADVVAAGHRDARLAAAREQRSEHVDRRAHARDELVRRLRVQRRGRRRCCSSVGAGPLDGRADGAQHVDHHVEVGDGIEVAQRRDAGREQRRRHLLGARVLGRARHAHRAVQRTAGADDEGVGHHACHSAKLSGRSSSSSGVVAIRHTEDRRDDARGSGARPAARRGSRRPARRRPRRWRGSRPARRRRTGATRG